jgi:hypothetical protein
MEEGLTLTGDWNKLNVALDPKLWTAAFEKSLSLSFKRLGMSWQKLAREMIKSKVYAPNADSTIEAWYERGSKAMRKKADKRASSQGITTSAARAAGKTPLIDLGDLFKSVGYDVSGLTLTLGASKSVVWRGMKYNIAAVLHEGAVIKQPRMKRTIVIPARPYIRTPIESEEFGNLFKQAVNEALKEAFGG